MDALRKSGDSIGAKLTVVAHNVPVGWGEPVFDRLDADIAHALMGINAVKGVEIGAGFACVTQKRQRARRRIHAGRLPVEQRRRHPRRHLHRAGHRRALRDQAHLQHPPRTQLHRQGGQAGEGLHRRPPRSLRRHSRYADRRGDAGAGADRPCVEASGAEWGCGLWDAEIALDFIYAPRRV